MESGNLCDHKGKLGIVMSVLADAHYDAVGLGETDLSSSKDRFFAEAEKNHLTVIDTRPDAPQSTVPYVIKNVGGARVGIVSFGATIPDPAMSEYVRRKTMYAAYKAARDGSDVLIVLDQGNVITSEWLDRNAPRLGAPDIVISGLQKQMLSMPEVHGRTQIMPTTSQGRYVGVVDVELNAGAEPKLTWSRLGVEGSVVEDEKVKAKITAFLQPQSVLPATTTAGFTPAPGSQPLAGGKPYYNPDLCKACHLKEYDDWSRTKHAGAIQTLVEADRLQPECLQCHSEQYRRLKTVTIPKDTIGGVECATCHMDALPHGLERRTVKTRTKVSAPSCMDCHTKDRSPAYNEKIYFPKVAHPSVTHSKSITSTASR